MTATTQQITFSVPDVSCAHCVAAVDEALGGLDGVATVTTDLTAKRVSVTLDPSRTTVPQVIAALDAAGYPATRS